MNKKYKLAVFNGRMSPIHQAHISLIHKALEVSERVLITIGSCNTPRTPENPWTGDERETMIRLSFGADVQDRIVVVQMEDRLYNNPHWAAFIQKAAREVANDEFELDKENVVFVACEKDAKSFWVRMFPQWDLMLVDKLDVFNGTDFREDYFSDMDWAEKYSSFISPRIMMYLEGWKHTQHYKYVLEEFEFLRMHNKKWENAPYEPSFNCSDAVVFKDAQVLLVRRRNAPGRGLWALPGGYINRWESSLDASIRELREETGLKVPEPVLRGSIIGKEVFEHPRRSLRGRIYSHTYVFELTQSGPNPKVKGCDDADKARWVTFEEFSNMRNVMFEDHADIIHSCMGYLSNRKLS